MSLHTGLYPYMGAKNKDASSLVEMFKYENEEGQPIERLVDTNFGAGNIVNRAAGLYKERISNDLDPQIALLADVACHEEERDKVICNLFKMDPSDELFKKCKALAANDCTERIERATAIWYIFLQSRYGNRSAFWSREYHSTLLNKINLFRNFDGVKILNMDMIKLLEEEKKNPELLRKTMYYLDPPYLENNARYKVNSTSAEFHRKLIETMKGIPYIMISGYDSQLYNELLVKKMGFYRHSLGERAEGLEHVERGQIRSTREEIVWTSYPVIGPYQQ